MVIPRFGLVGQFLRVIMQPKSIFRILPQPNPNFRMLGVRNLVGLALCLAVADRATGSPQDPLKPISSETKPTESVNQEITNLLKAYEKALNSHDPKAVMALYGSDPIFIPQNAEAFIGREAVQARYQHGSQTVNGKFTATCLPPPTRRRRTDVGTPRRGWESRLRASLKRAIASFLSRISVPAWSTRFKDDF
jgi:hypothetical protein